MRVMRAPRPLLALTMGDPVGVGPEVVLKAASVDDIRAVADLAVFGDPLILERASHDTAVPAEIVEIQRVEEARAAGAAGRIPVLPVSQIRDPKLSWGQPTAESDRAQVEYIRRAFTAVDARAADALVTGPINKAALGRAGVKYAGHTELLSALSGGAKPLMMLAGPTLKVVPLTIHAPLKDVPSLITEGAVRFGIELVHETLIRRFGVRRPRIAVAGLNPHASEEGLFGREDVDVIRPAVVGCRSQGIDVQGPLSGDTVFHRAVVGEFDVVIGMYHDQALIPIKLLDFDQAVNVTLGLPVIRTSVDHGTAYDIAGQGVASATSLMAAIRLAVRMVGARGVADSSATEPATSE